jgi:hypothetical protein
MKDRKFSPWKIFLTFVEICLVFEFFIKIPEFLRLWKEFGFKFNGRFVELIGIIILIVTAFIILIKNIKRGFEPKVHLINLISYSLLEGRNEQQDKELNKRILIYRIINIGGYFSDIDPLFRGY